MTRANIMLPIRYFLALWHEMTSGGTDSFDKSDPFYGVILFVLLVSCMGGIILFLFAGLLKLMG